MNRPLSLALAAALALTTFAADQKKRTGGKVFPKRSAPTKEITSPRDPATGQATGRTKAPARNKQ
jgi:hypothetical protein